MTTTKFLQFVNVLKVFLNFSDFCSLKTFQHVQNDPQIDYFLHPAPQGVKSFLGFEISDLGTFGGLEIFWPESF